MKQWAFMLAFVVTCSARAEGPATTERSSTWRPEKFPISFWCGPPPKFVNEEQYQRIADAGFTLIMPSCSGGGTPEENRKVLDTAQAVGLKAFISDGRMPLWRLRFSHRNGHAHHGTFWGLGENSSRIRLNGEHRECRPHLRCWLALYFDWQMEGLVRLRFPPRLQSIRRRNDYRDRALRRILKCRLFQVRCFTADKHYRADCDFLCRVGRRDLLQRPRKRCAPKVENKELLPVCPGLLFIVGSTCRFHCELRGPGNLPP